MAIPQSRAHLGAYYEIDVFTYEEDEPRPASASFETSGGIATAAPATATAISPPPTFVADFDPAEQYAYEVLVFDHDRDRQLVAAIEIVSPANKGRPESRRAFVAKCATLLQNRVCVSLVDLVTIRKFNLYAELLELFGQADPALKRTRPATYATTCRGLKLGDRSRFESWVYPLVVGQPLPPLPIWLTDEMSVMLDLEASYEAACRALRIA